MSSNHFLFSCVFASVVLWAGSANADNATITLDVNYSGTVGTAGSWQLSGRVDDTGSGVNGDFGLSAVRALLDGIDFGTNGDAITFTPGNGAIDPLLDSSGNVLRPPVLQQLSGTVDLIYGQDLSESETFPGSGIFNSVVPLVGTSGDVLLASGTFSAGLTPAFGQDDTGPVTLFTQALFLANGTAPYSFSIDPDSTFLVTNFNTGTPLAGDANDDGVVDLLDLDILGTNFGLSPATFAQGDFNDDDTVDLLDLDILGTNFGNSSGAGLTVPEPSAIVLSLTMVSMALYRRQQG